MAIYIFKQGLQRSLQIGRIRFPLGWRTTSTHNNLLDKLDNDEPPDIGPNSASMDDNTELRSLFTSLLPQLTDLLVAWNVDNPVIASWTKWLKKCAPANKGDATYTWIHKGNPHVRTLKAEELLFPSLEELLASEKLNHLNFSEASQRVWGVGAMFLYLIAIQHNLGEPITLDGVLLKELDDSDPILMPPKVVRHALASEAGLEKMWSSIDPLGIKLRKNWGPDKLSRFRSQFDAEHIVHDPKLKAPRFQRLATTVPALSSTIPLPQPEPAVETGPIAIPRVAKKLTKKAQVGKKKVDPVVPPSTILPPQPEPAVETGPITIPRVAKKLTKKAQVGEKKVDPVVLRRSSRLVKKN